MNNFSNPSHRSVKDKLNGELGETFITNFYLDNELWQTTKASPSRILTTRHIEEYPIVQEVGHKDDGTPIYNTKFIDYVFLLHPSKGAVTHQSCLTIGLEIKSSEKDLKRAPEQLKTYIEHCDYFFLAVKEWMADTAISIVKSNPKVGVMSVDSGEIYKMPSASDTPTINRLMMYQRLAFCSNQDMIKNIFPIDLEET
ncbi:MAG: hypothetical protein MJY97_01440 [Bacteroidales bacterium]|nr:hypothetical protein [Bacteroidales bacterium]